jgi:hypothetical protein
MKTEEMVEETFRNVTPLQVSLQMAQIPTPPNSAIEKIVRFEKLEQIQKVVVVSR